MAGFEATDYFEYRLNVLNPTAQMPIHFAVDQMFILNVSDAPLYMNLGSIKVPTPQAFDRFIPPRTYAIYIPQPNVREFAALLNGVTAWDCWIIFRRGGAVIHQPFPSPDFFYELQPLPDPAVVADFTFVVSP